MSIQLVNFLNAPYEVQFETRNWRNSEQVTKYFQLKHIDEETHKVWLNKLKDENPNNIAFLIEHEGKFVGVTYFHSVDYDKKQCDWGIYIYDTALRGKKIGQTALSLSLDYAKNILKMKKVYLEVLDDNTVAISVYEKIGFKFLENKNNNILRYKKEL